LDVDVLVPWYGESTASYELSPSGCGGGVVCVAVFVADRKPNDLGQCSHLHMGSLCDNNIGNEGVRDLGAALQVNTTLTTLE
jgi:hypothetical protein